MNPIIVAKQMIILFLIVLIGTFLRKKELATDEHSKFMSSMVINVFNPALIFTSAVSQKCEDTTMVYKTFIFCAAELSASYYYGKNLSEIFCKRTFGKKYLSDAFRIFQCGLYRYTCNQCHVWFLCPCICGNLYYGI